MKQLADFTKMPKSLITKGILDSVCKPIQKLDANTRGLMRLCGPEVMTKVNASCSGDDKDDGKGDGKDDGKDDGKGDGKDDGKGDGKDDKKCAAIADISKELMDFTKMTNFDE